MSSSLPNKRDVEMWNVEQVAAYIQQMQIGDCQQAFLKRGIHGRAFLDLSETSLLYWSGDLNVGSRKKIARLVKDINNQGSGPKSSPRTFPSSGGGVSSSPAFANGSAFGSSSAGGSGIFAGARLVSGTDEPNSDVSDDEDDEGKQLWKQVGRLSGGLAPQPTNNREPVEDQDGYLMVSTTTRAENNVYEPMNGAHAEQIPAPWPTDLNNPPDLPPRNQSAAVSDGRPNTGGPVGGTVRSISSQPPVLKQAPKRTFPLSGPPPRQHLPFVLTPRFPLAPSPGPSGGPFKPPLSLATTALRGTETGVVGPPRRIIAPHFIPQNSSSDVTNGSSGQGFQSQHNAQPFGKKPSLHPQIFPNQSPLKAPNDGGSGGDVTAATLKHGPGRGSSLQKGPPPLLPPSDGNGLNTGPKLGGITGVRRLPDLENKGSILPKAIAPAPPAPHMTSVVSRPSAAEDTSLEEASEFQHQESIRLSTDGPRIALTPLYKSLVQQDFFHLVTRDNAETLLNGCSAGSFLVRPSTRGHPLTLMVVTSQGGFCNVGIRHRTDDVFALGAEKHNEKAFKTVDELIEFYSKNHLKLNTGGEVLLSNSPPHDATHIYVRVPIRNGFPGTRGRDGS